MIIDRRPDPHLPLTTQETIYTLCIKQNKTIYPCLLQSIDGINLNLTDKDKNSLLHLSASLLMSDTCSKLIAKSANVNIENNKKNTPLLEILEHYLGADVKKIENEMVNTVTVLIRAGASCNIGNKDERQIMETATSLESEKLLLAMIENVEKIDFMNNNLWRSWMDKKYFILIAKLLDRDGQLLNQYITINDIKDNILDVDMFLILELYLLAKKYVQKSVLESILYKAAKEEDVTIFKEMIKKKIYDNSCLGNEESLLDYLIQERKRKFIYLIFRSSNSTIFMAKKNQDNHLPLHVCIYTEYWEILDDVITNTYMVNEEDNDGNTAISMLLSKISTTDDDEILYKLLRAVKSLITKRGDINHVNKYNKAAIDYCTDNELKSKLQEYAIMYPITDLNTSSYPIPDSALQGDISALPVCEQCNAEPRNCALNCGHLICMECAKKVKQCYTCSKPITDRRFIYDD